MKTGSLGPIDGVEWTDKLVARVADGAQRRIHGYGIDDDLARHYGPSEVTMLALLGELPTEQARRAFDVAMVFAAAISKGDAPAHAASLTRMCFGTTSAVIATAATTLAEEGRFEVARFAAWRGFVEGTGGAPEGEGVSLDDRVAGRHLREACRIAGIDVPALERDMPRTIAILALLHVAGFRTAETLHSAWVLARLPVVLAEALATPQGGFREYPLGSPRFVYKETRDG
jgi:hypothetical protein